MAINVDGSVGKEKFPRYQKSFQICTLMLENTKIVYIYVNISKVVQKLCSVLFFFSFNNFFNFQA